MLARRYKMLKSRNKYKSVFSCSWFIAGCEYYHDLMSSPSWRALTALITWPVSDQQPSLLLLLTHHVSVCRSGFRTDAPSGRSARRPPMCSGLRGLSCRRTTACLSSRPPRQQQRPWATASAPSTPTTPAGPRRGCPACLNCSYRRLWAASRPWRSPCLSVASAPGRRPTPWVYPTCRQTAPGSSHTSTSPLSPGWYPRPCRARPTWPARLSCVVPRTVTSGEGQASPRCAAKRSSTQYPWVSPSEGGPPCRAFLSPTHRSSAFTSYSPPPSKRCTGKSTTRILVLLHTWRVFLPIKQEGKLKLFISRSRA